MKIILILTMLYVPGSGTAGSIATAEFGSWAACKDAGKRWEAQIEDKARHPARHLEGDTFYLCVGEFIK